MWLFIKDVASLLYTRSFTGVDASSFTESACGHDDTQNEKNVFSAVQVFKPTCKHVNLHWSVEDLLKKVCIMSPSLSVSLKGRKKTDQYAQ